MRLDQSLAPPSYVRSTHHSMEMCKRRIHLYAKEYGKLPSSLSETKQIRGENSSINDAWSVVIDYTIDTNGIVTLSSLGKDHSPGGKGPDADMIGIFPSKKQDGSWSDEFVHWSQDPW